PVIFAIVLLPLLNIAFGLTPYGIIEADGEKQENGSKFYAIYGSKGPILLSSKEIKTPQSPDYGDKYRVTLATSTLFYNDPSKPIKSELINPASGFSLIKINNITNSYFGSSDENTAYEGFENGELGILFGSGQNISQIKPQQGMLFGDIINKAVVKKSKDNKMRSTTRVRFQHKGEIKGGLLNYGVGDNIVQFLHGGVIGSDILATNSGLNIITLGDIHLDIKHSVLVPHFYRSKKVDAIILSSVPQKTKSIQNEKDAILKVAKIDITGRKSDFFQVLKLSSKRSIARQSLVEFRLFIDRENNRGIHPGKLEIPRCPPQSGGNANFNQHKNYGKAYNDRIIIDSKGIALNVYPIFEIASSCPGNAGHVNSANNTTSGSLIKDKGGDRNIAILSELNYIGNGSDGEKNIAIATIKTSSLSKNYGKDGGSFVTIPEISLGFDVVKTKLAKAATNEFGKITNAATTTPSGSSASANGSAGTGAAGAAARDANKTLDYTTFFLNGVDYALDIATKNALLNAHNVAFDAYYANEINVTSNAQNAQDAPYNLWGNITTGLNTSSHAQADYRDYKVSHALNNTYQNYVIGFDANLGHLNNLLKNAFPILPDLPLERHAFGALIGHSRSSYQGILGQNLNSVTGEAEGLKSGFSNALNLAIYYKFNKNYPDIEAGDKPFWMDNIHAKTMLKFDALNHKLSFSGVENKPYVKNKAISLDQSLSYDFNPTRELILSIEARGKIGLIEPIKMLSWRKGNFALRSSQSSLNHALSARSGMISIYDLTKLANLSEGDNLSAHFGAYIGSELTKSGEILIISDKSSEIIKSAYKGSLNLQFDLGSKMHFGESFAAELKLSGKYFGVHQSLYKGSLIASYSF
ncbi:MAG: hypothetical protein E7K04_02330, partial [Helicobacter sp.]|nr:hypothetical protein [Helicobacter sp.]